MIINTIIQGSGGGSSDPYPLLSRVTDDNNNDIGCVAGYLFDSNNQKYAIVCLNAQYRNANAYVASAAAVIFPNTPSYDSLSVYAGNETATFCCDDIMAWVNGGSGRTSTAVSHCRAQTFTIDGVSYSGQLPTFAELVVIFQKQNQINSDDPTATSNPTLVLPVSNSMATVCSCSQNLGGMWDFYGDGSTYYDDKKNSSSFVIPILEIPIP